MVNAMLLAKPNPQNYYSVTVALYRPNLLIELKRFLFISFSFSLCSCLLSLLFSFSLFFVFPFFLFSCFLVVSFCLFCCPAPFSPCQDQSRLCPALWAKRKDCLFSTAAFHLFLCWCNVVSLCARCSRRICVVLLIYNNVGCRKVCVDCCFRLLTCAKIEQRF